MVTIARYGYCFALLDGHIEFESSSWWQQLAVAVSLTLGAAIQYQLWTALCRLLRIAKKATIPAGF